MGQNFDDYPDFQTKTTQHLRKDEVGLEEIFAVVPDPVDKLINPITIPIFKLLFIQYFTCSL